jgi:hypothetical protein
MWSNQEATRTYSPPAPVAGGTTRADSNASGTTRPGRPAALPTMRPTTSIGWPLPTPTWVVAPPVGTSLRSCPNGLCLVVIVAPMFCAEKESLWLLISGESNGVSSKEWLLQELSVCVECTWIGSKLIHCATRKHVHWRNLKWCCSSPPFYCSNPS